MKTVFKTVSYLALVGTLAPPILYFNDAITLSLTKTLLLIAALVWFGTAPFWMEHKASE